MRNLLLGVALVLVVLEVCSGLALQASAAEMESKTVEVSGTGASIKEAVSAGLIEAIGQVSGRFIESESQLNSVEISATDGADQEYFTGQAFQDKVKTATKGAVKEYGILQQSVDSKGIWEVRLRVTCLRMVPGLTNRKKVICWPFAFKGRDKASLPGGNESPRTGGGSGTTIAATGQMFTDHLEAYLVQSRKFMVIDRRQTDAVESERNLALTANLPVEEVIRVAGENVADLVVGGGIETLEYKTRKQIMPSGMEIQHGEGTVEIAFRVIDVASRQVKYADRVSERYTDDDLRNLSGAAVVDQAESLMLANVANRIGKQILEAIYPVTIVAVSGDTVTLNEGGRGIVAGEIYEVYVTGDEITDPATGESLGRQEIPVGRIKITESNAKTALASVTVRTGVIAPGAICRFSKRAVEDEKAKGKNATPAPGKKFTTDDLY